MKSNGIKHDSFTFVTLIKGLKSWNVNVDSPAKAIEILEMIKREYTNENLIPDLITHSNAAKGCCDLGKMNRQKKKLFKYS